jgi:hypothetical protein
LGLEVVVGSGQVVVGADCEDGAVVLEERVRLLAWRRRRKKSTSTP